MIFSRESWRETGAIEGGRRGVAVFPASWPVFAAHFPGRPVVPAWVLIGAVRSLCEESVGRALELAAIERVKLARPIGPDEPVSFEVLIEAREGEWRTRAQLSAPAGSVGSIGLRLVAVS